MPLTYFVPKIAIVNLNSKSKQLLEESSRKWNLNFCTFWACSCWIFFATNAHLSNSKFFPYFFLYRNCFIQHPENHFSIQDKTAKAFSPKGCSMNDTSYRNITIMSDK